MKPKDLVKLTEVEGLINAQIIESKLKHFNIPCMLKYDSAAHLYGITLDGLGKVAVIVPREFLDRAKEIIEEEK